MGGWMLVEAERNRQPARKEEERKHKKKQGGAQDWQDSLKRPYRSAPPVQEEARRCAGLSEATVPERPTRA